MSFSYLFDLLNICWVMGSSPAVLCFGDIVLSMWCGLVSGVARRSRAPPIGEDLWQLALELKQLPEFAFSAKAASLVGLVFAG